MNYQQLDKNLQNIVLTICFNCLSSSRSGLCKHFFYLFSLYRAWIHHSVLNEHFRDFCLPLKQFKSHLKAKIFLKFLKFQVPFVLISQGFSIFLGVSKILSVVSERHDAIPPVGGTSEKCFQQSLSNGGMFLHSCIVMIKHLQKRRNGNKETLWYDWQNNFLRQCGGDGSANRAGGIGWNKLSLGEYANIVCFTSETKLEQAFPSVENSLPFLPFRLQCERALLLSLVQQSAAMVRLHAPSMLAWIFPQRNGKFSKLITFLCSL